MTTSIKPTKQTLSKAMPSLAQVASCGRFNLASIAALHSSTFAEGFSNNECQAAARALLRHDMHVNGTHYQMRTPKGLHPSYISFNPPMEEMDKRTLTQDDLLEVRLQDIFDAVNFQDHLDSGISLTYYLLCWSPLKLGDDILPKLQMLASTIHSSQWEAVFRSLKWDLSYEHVSLLAKALLTDLQGFALNPDAVKILGILVFLLNISSLPGIPTYRHNFIFEQEDLLKGFAEQKETKTLGVHILMKLKGITFATEGVQNFICLVMGIDNQDFVPGKVINSSSLTHTPQSTGSLMLDSIKEITGEPHAIMQWTYYFHNVVQCYQVIITGWLDNIKFTNLSNVSSALPDLKMLKQQ
ncbi:hypothetical protein BDR05DRAFT_947357 [Suillus weaverae]|nr:hypothetical protein BDR05DRAFT_947357 [Suillus weaverae]